MSNAVAIQDRGVVMFLWSVPWPGPLDSGMFPGLVMWSWFLS
jgi:hypothetical protein